MLICVALLTAFLFLRGKYGKHDERNIAWLAAHRVGEGPVDSPLTLQLSPDLLGKRLILLAEIHGTAAPQQVDLALLRALNSDAGVHDYLAEVDPVQAAMFNRYLDSGDEASLRRIFDLWTPNAQWGNTDFEDKVRSIRSFNAGIPITQQVRFTGIDEVQDYPLAVQWIEQQCGCKASPDTGQKADSVQQAKSTLDFLNQARLMDTVTGAALRQALTKTAMGHNREKTIFESYAWQVKEGSLRDRQAYGMWGLNHGLQDKLANGFTFAGLVKRSKLPAANSLVTLACLPTDAEMMMPAVAAPKFLRPRDGSNPNMPYSGDGPLVYMAGIQDLRRAVSGPHKTTIFRLDGPGSPYGNGLPLGPGWSPFGSIPMSKPNAVTTDYIQYVVYSDGSRAVRPRHQGQ